MKVTVEFKFSQADIDLIAKQQGKHFIVTRQDLSRFVVGAVRADLAVLQEKHAQETQEFDDAVDKHI